MKDKQKKQKITRSEVPTEANSSTNDCNDDLKALHKALVEHGVIEKITPENEDLFFTTLIKLLVELGGNGI